MKRMRWLPVVAILAFAVLLAGCGGPSYEVAVRLKNPVPDAAASAEANTIVYSDDDLAIGFSSILNTAVRFSIQNKTDQTMRIIWDDTVFVDIDNSTSRVMHLGVRYIDRNDSQPPTVIPSGARVDDQIVPTKNVYYQSGRYGGWRTRPIIPQDSRALDYDGQVISVVMPIEIGGERSEYRFDFEVLVRER